MNANKVLKTAGFMVAATLLSKVFGLLREILIAQAYGTTQEAVAFSTASRIPILLFDFVIGGVISSTFIPVFNEYLQREGKPAAMRFANLYVNTVLFITIIITVLGVTFSSGLIRIIAPDIPENTKILAQLLSNILFPMIIFTGLAYSFVGLLQSFGEFNIPSIISLVSNGVMILYFPTLQKSFGIVGLAVAMLIGWGLQMLIQVPSLKKFGFSYRPTLSFRDEGIRRAGRLAVPMLISTWVQPLCSLINMRLASNVEDGAGITAMDYAYKIYTLVVGIFSFVITNLLFPYLARASASNQEEEMHQLTVTALRVVAFIIAPIMVLFFLLSEPIISLIYERGVFGAHQVTMTATALRFYALGMVAIAFCEIFNKFFFACQDSKTPMKTSVFSIAVNILLSVLLFRLIGFAGLAVATAIASIVNAMALFFFMKKKHKQVFTSSDWVDLLKISLCSLVMALAVWFLSSHYGTFLLHLPFGVFWLLLATGGVGALLYLVCSLLFRVTETKLFLQAFRKKQ